MLTLDGKTQCLTAWAREFGINRRTLQDRIDAGWGLDKALAVAPHAAPRSDSVLKIMGVRQLKNGRFIARSIGVGKQVYIGTYVTLDEATEAVKKFSNDRIAATY